MADVHLDAPLGVYCTGNIEREQRTYSTGRV